MAQVKLWGDQSESSNLSCFNCSSNEMATFTTTAVPVTDSSDIWPWRVGLFGLGGTIIACVGVVANITAIVVLAQYRTKSTAPFLLISLEVFDTLFLVSEMILESLTSLAKGGVISDSYRDFVRPVYCILYPVPFLARTCSAYLVVLITLERYTVVAWPLTAHRLLRPRVARLAVVVVVSFILVYHIPLYLAYTCSTRFNNETQSERIYFYRTSFGLSHFYIQVYHTWINLVFHFVLPFLVLLIFNVLLLVALKKSKVQGPTPTEIQNRAKRERRLTVIVLFMTGIFFFLELFPAVSFILTTGLNRYSQCSIACIRFSAIADTMTMLNAAINFIIYCATGKKFRDIFKQAFCRRATSRDIIGMRSSHSSGENNTSSKDTHSSRNTSNRLIHHGHSTRHNGHSAHHDGYLTHHDDHSSHHDGHTAHHDGHTAHHDGDSPHHGHNAHHSNGHEDEAFYKKLKRLSCCADVHPRGSHSINKFSHSLTSSTIISKELIHHENSQGQVVKHSTHKL